ncbi:MAG: hypothetical protein G01um101456_243 [Parcubacteria group bacterium Gr01-1014_56]|nr:MAG: hypothetical protein G01um101456_243 [Parcubacteria group bacterium Gr01-1014_56]
MYRFLKTYWFWRFLVFLLLSALFTTLIIIIHTPKPDPWMFDFSCMNSGPCPVTIDQNSQANFQDSVENAIHNSNRLGKLSEVYMSVMQFDVHVYNFSIAYIKAPSTTPPLDGKKLRASIQCLEGNLGYGQAIPITGNFSLSDPVDRITKLIEFHVTRCPGFIIEKADLEGLPVFPPNSEIKMDYGPKFSPKFTPDIYSWVLVFGFNCLILLGFLPLIREGIRFLKKGSRYFD